MIEMLLAIIAAELGLLNLWFLGLGTFTFYNMSREQHRPQMQMPVFLGRPIQPTQQLQEEETSVKETGQYA